MISNKRNQDLKDGRKGNLDEQNKKQLRETTADEQEDTSRKGGSALGRRDRHGKKQ